MKALIWEWLFGWICLLLWKCIWIEVSFKNLIIFFSRFIFNEYFFSILLISFQLWSRWGGQVQSNSRIKGRNNFPFSPKPNACLRLFQTRSSTRCCRSTTSEILCRISGEKRYFTFSYLMSHKPRCLKILCTLESR